MPKTVRTTRESETGRNLAFHDNKSGKDMTRPKFVGEIEKGNFTGYHIRKINGIKTPVSNPDRSENNNLD
jgi:hypothetical protein